MRTALPPFLLALALATSVEAQSLQVVSVLNGGDVTPTKVLTGAFAIAELTVNPTSREIAYDVQVLNLPSGIRGAHVHVGSPEVVGPALFDLRPASGQSGDFRLRGTMSVADLTTRPELGIRDIVDAFESVVGLATTSTFILIAEWMENFGASL